MAAGAPERVRDAERSRQALLAAAERLFADRGYEGASLNHIATEAGLSRGTPNYFFGSKQALYLEVIERAFSAREAATCTAFGPVYAWCESDGDLDALRQALRSAASDYMSFLGQRPEFAKLVMHEELLGGRSIHVRRSKSTAMEDAFASLRRVGPRRGLRQFAVADAILLFLALTFAPMSLSHTLMRAVKRDLAKPPGRRAQVELAVDQLMHLLAA